MNILNHINNRQYKKRSYMTFCQMNFMIGSIENFSQNTVECRPWVNDLPQEPIIKFDNDLHFWLFASNMLYWLANILFIGSNDAALKTGFIDSILEFSKGKGNYSRLIISTCSPKLEIDRLHDDPHADFVVSKIDKNQTVLLYNIPSRNVNYYSLFLFALSLSFFADRHPRGTALLSLGMSQFIVLVHKNGVQFNNLGGLHQIANLIQNDIGHSLVGITEQMG